VIAQKPIVGIEIDRIQRFVGGIMKSARKIRMTPEHRDVFGSNPKLQFNFFWPTVHDALPMPADGTTAVFYPIEDLGTSVQAFHSSTLGTAQKR
jgi:hypothetical protein